MPGLYGFAEDRLSDEVNRAFALIYMGERCFVVVFAKRNRTLDASRTISETREGFGCYKTNKAGLSWFSHSRLSSASRWANY